MAFRYYVFCLHMDSKISWGASLCKIHSSHPVQTLAVNAALRFRRHPAIAELHCMYQLWPPFYDSCYVNPNLVISSFSRTTWSTWKPESSHKNANPVPVFSLLLSFLYSTHIWVRETLLAAWCEQEEKCTCSNDCAFISPFIVLAKE